MNKYAILIGNSQFPDESDKSKLPNLACPEQDVDGLSTVLASERGEFEVLPLKNKPHYEILDKLQDVVNQAEKEDLLLIYYSGHGKPNKAGILHLTTFDTVVNKLESRAIPINRVYDILGTGKAKKIVILLDCCYSGAAGQGFKGAVDDQLQQLNNARGTYLVTASTELQVAHESAAEGLSLFTKHLIAGLETGEADKDGDGWVSMNELYDYVQGKVVAENPAQQPTKHVKEERGGLLIVKSGKDSEKERIKKIEHYFYDLAKEEKITTDILTEVLTLLKNSRASFSSFENQRYSLIVELFEDNLKAVEFVRRWDWLTFEVLEQEKSVKANTEQERLKQEKYELANIVEDKTAREAMAHEIKNVSYYEKEKSVKNKKTEIRKKSDQEELIQPHVKTKLNKDYKSNIIVIVASAFLLINSDSFFFFLMSIILFFIGITSSIIKFFMPK